MLRSRRFWIRACVFLLLIGVAVSGWYMYSVHASITKTTEHMHTPLNRGDHSPLRSEHPLPKKEDKHPPPLSFALFGTDVRPGDSGRTDTIIVMTINPAHENAYILSIPRDTRTELVGLDREDKINHAYAYGGIDTAVASVEQLLNIPIDYYALVNMNGFIEVVDILDGIDVDVPHAFTYKAHTFEEGTMHMNGEQALAFARMRYDDPEGDHGRNERQRLLVKAMIQRLKSVQSVFHINRLLESASKHVRTNQKREDIVRLYTDYASTASTVETIHLDGQSERFTDGIWYFQVDEESRQQISQRLRKHLNLEEESA